MSIPDAPPRSIPSLRLRRLWWALGAAGVLGVIVLSVIPDPVGLPGDSEGWGGHVLAYAATMAWFARLEPRGSRRAAWALAFCLLGIALEFVQGWTGRSYDEGDMIADALGVLAGWLASPPRVPHGVAGLDRWLCGRFQRNPGSSA